MTENEILFWVFLIGIIWSIIAVYIEIIEDKKISSFPEIKEILETAFGKSLDNYNSFEELCKEAVDLLMTEIKNMTEERNNFIEKKLPARMRERKGQGNE